MPYRLCRRILLPSLFLLAVTVAAAHAAAGLPASESPAFLRAANVLPRSLLSGPGYVVDPLVRNDGGVNIYMLHSPKGDLRVASTAVLYQRIHELQAAAAMDAVDTGAAFGQSVVDSGVGTLRGAVNLIVHPIDTLSGAASGLGKAVTRTTASLESRRPADDAGGVAGVLGYNRAKRDCAKRFGVDPYARNSILQASLDRLARAGFAGGLSASAAKMVIPGGVGLAVGAVSGAQTLNDIDVSMPPQELFARNMVRMQAMGVPEGAARLFIENPHFTPTGQSRLVAALHRMAAVGNRAAFIDGCVLTDDDDLARFQERQAGLYANVNAVTDRLTRLVPVGDTVAARTASGGFLWALPVDYLFWTSAMARLAGMVDAAARVRRAAGKTLVVAGMVSPLAAAKLRRAGWSVICLRVGLAPVGPAPRQ